MASSGSLRQIRRRIRSVENTKKITRAMEMVAAAKLRRFQDFLESARPYTERMERLVNRLLGEAPANYKHPFRGQAALSSLSPFSSLVLFTSDTGLCGTYNNDLEERTREWLDENKDQDISFVFVGKQGCNAFHKRPGRILGTFFDLRVSRVDEILEGLRRTLEEAYLQRTVVIDIIYTYMETLSRYSVRLERLLPIPPRPAWKVSEVPTLIEPDAKTVLDKLLPAFLETRLRFIFYHALVTEQIARRSAMRQATQNAEEMIEELTLLRNKARQAAITKEIIEVVSGSRALKLK